VVESDKLVGMIARADLVRAVAVAAEEASPAPMRDGSEYTLGYAGGLSDEIDPAAARELRDAYRSSRGADHEARPGGRSCPVTF
jgi:hypothetical protein